MGLAVVLLGSFGLFVSAQQEVIYECVDDLDEYQQSRWYGEPVSPKYAQQSENLPAALQQKLNGSGLFYFEKNGQSHRNQSMWKKPSDFPDLAPIFIYIRYYTHIQNPGPQSAYIMPVKDFVNGPLKYLDPTENYEWAEAMVEINANLVSWISISVHLDNFEPTDFFVLDKIIIVQGAEINSISHIKEYCPEKPPTTPTTLAPTTTTAIPTTTTAVPTTTTAEPTTTTAEPTTTEAARNTTTTESAPSPTTTEEPANSTTRRTTTRRPTTITTTIEADPTTTEESGNGNTTTQRPPIPGDCIKDGYAADPYDCTIFHVCQYYPDGSIWDTVMDCPLMWTADLTLERLTWCQEVLRCEWPEICPCEIEGIPQL